MFSIVYNVQTFWFSAKMERHIFHISPILTVNVVHSGDVTTNCLMFSGSLTIFSLHFSSKIQTNVSSGSLFKLRHPNFLNGIEFPTIRKMMNTVTNNIVFCFSHMACFFSVPFDDVDNILISSR